MRHALLLALALGAGCQAATTHSSGSTRPRHDPSAPDAGSGEASDAHVRGPDPDPIDAGSLECASVTSTAETVLAPVDIVWVVDSSGSMSNEALRVQDNLNVFTAAIGASGLDFHLVMVTSSSYVSVPPPLGADAAHYRFVERSVGSHAPLDRLLSELPLYRDFLRPDAVTHFVAVTDDESDLGGESFRASMEAELGHPFVLHAIASERPECPGAANPGDEYYALAAATGGETMSICTDDWGGVFDRLRMAIERSAPLPCIFELPAPPPGMDYLRDRVEVLFTPSAAPRQTVPQVGSADRCGAGGFYFSSATRIELCASTCDLVSADRDGRIDIALGCAVVPI